jgi:DSF synthase
MRPHERPSFTTGLLGDLARSQRSIKRLFADAPSPEDQPLRFYVLASRLPGVFNLGGNLSLFAERIRQRDRGSLMAYARSCIEVLYTNAVSFNRPVVTIALVQGDALGGGFEAALSCNVIIAERGAKFGLPEVLFNLFPGMGAYSFLSRKLGAARAEELIMSGRTYGSEEMHAMGLVHRVVEPGQGEDAVRGYIERSARRHRAHCGIYRAGQAVNPLPFEELVRVAEFWVDGALGLGEADLRVMERLVARQDRRRTEPHLIAAE